MHKDDIPMTYHCEQDWEEMTPHARGKLCGHCDKVVVDVSTMTRHEFTEFDRTRHAQNLCMKLTCRPDGHVIFARAPTRKYEGSLVDWLTLPTQSPRRALGVVTALTLSLAACGDHEPQSAIMIDTEEITFVHFDALNDEPAFVSDPSDLIAHHAATDDAHEASPDALTDAPQEGTQVIKAHEMARDDQAQPADTEEWDNTSVMGW